uniref:Cell division protein n=1 Tax=Phacotus lenticularis TaxID=52965 RepID=A0A0S2LQV8_9CHLO|nr:cell division protein [Phacotus lenticularis]ALO63577.1 cell division protein [Phacotus lenticularis]
MKYKAKNLYFNSLNHTIINPSRDLNSLTNKTRKNLTIINSYGFQSPFTLNKKHILAMSTFHSCSKIVSVKRDKVCFLSIIKDNACAPRPYASWVKSSFRRHLSSLSGNLTYLGFPYREPQKILSLGLNHTNQSLKGMRSTIKSGSSAPINFKLSPALNQGLDQSRKLKTKSKKFPTFLQFLLYQDLYSPLWAKPVVSNPSGLPLGLLRNNSFNKQHSAFQAFDGKNTVFGYSALLNSVYLPMKEKVNEFSKRDPNSELLITELDYNLANKFSYTNRKWSSFFPYKKSFLCYWLLPVMGFVSYVSNQDSRQSFLFEKQIGNNGWSISLKSSSNSVSLPLEEAILINSGDLISTLDLNLTGGKNLSLNSFFNKVFLFSINLKQSFKDYWYKTSLISNSFNGEILRSDDLALISGLESNKSLEHNNFYPHKFYDVPLTYLPFTSSVQRMQPVEENQNSFDLKQKTNKVSSSVIGLKNLVRTKKTHFVLQKLFTSGNLLTSSNRHKGLIEEKNYLLGISSELPMTNLDVIVNPSGSLKGNSNSLSAFEEGNLKNSYFFPTLSPGFSYQKAMFLMDEYAKGLIGNELPLNSSSKKVHNKYNNVINPQTLWVWGQKVWQSQNFENIKKGMNLVPFSINLSTLKGNKTQNGNALGLYKDSNTFPKTNSLTASTGNSTKISFLEQILSFLLSAFKEGTYAFPISGEIGKVRCDAPLGDRLSMGSLAQEENKDGSNVVYTSLTENFLINKLTKNKLYFIILNSLVENMKEVKTIKALLSKKITEKNTPLTNNNGAPVFKLNHPLLFSSIPKPVTYANILKPSNSNNHKDFSQLINFSSSTKLDKNSPSQNNEKFYFTPRPKGSEGLFIIKDEKFKIVNNSSAEEQSTNFKILSKYYSKLSSRTKYVNYLSLRFKQILTPLYSSSLVKEKGLNLPLGLANTKEHGHLDNLNEKRIEKVFRSYLSKKRKSLKKASSSYFSKKKGLRETTLFNMPSKKFKKTLVSKKVTLLGIQEKMKKLLGRKKYNPEGVNAFLSSLKTPLQNKKNSQKVSTINSLFKNRVFILKKAKPDNIFISDKYNLNSPNSFTLVQNVGLGTNFQNPVLDNRLEKEENNINLSYFEKLEKNKYAQKKHRRKKQRKETRRRKKRKRFYPRPSWSRNKMYQNILLKLSFSGFQKPSVKLNSQKVFQKSHNWTKNNSLNLVNNLPLYSTKDFYQIKSSVLGELKRSFWKSYWLRSNLNPYLNQIKTNLKEIEKASTKETLYYNLRNLIMSVSGLNQIPTGSHSNTIHNTNFNSGLNLPVKLPADFGTAHNRSELLKGTSQLPIKENKGDSVVTNGFPNLCTNLSFLNKLVSSNPEGVRRLTMPSKKNLTTHVNDLTGSQNKWQLMTQIAEHNRIMYERIQNLILNIRENLTLNGQFKARAYKRAGRLKFKSLATLKQVNPNNPQTNPDFWSKLGKTTASLFSQSSIKYYGDLSNNRLYWAMHKSNLGSFKTVNKIKSLWANTKNRDQSKANKTKKIFYDIHNKYASFLNYSFIKEKFSYEYPNQILLNKRSTSLESSARLLEPLSVFKISNSFVKCQWGTGTNAFQPSKFGRVNELKSALLVSQRKIRHKDQKLLSLGLNHKQVGAPALENSKQPYGLGIKDSVMLPGHIKKLTNQITYWWTGSQMKIIPTFSTNYVSLNSSSQLGHSSNLLMPQGHEMFFATNLTVLGAITFIFHFCALVSLISISQIRDFIKFVLIVTSKVSKIYLQVIYSSFNGFVGVTKNMVLNSSKKTLNPFLFTSLNFNFAHKKPYYQYKGFKTKQNSHFFTNSLGLQNTTQQRQVPSKEGTFKKNSLVNKNKKVTYTLLVTLFKKLLTNSTLNSKKFEKVDLASQAVKKSVFKQGPLKVIKSLYSIILYSAINALIFSFSNLSYLTYSYFIKSLNLVEICVRAIYTFFEKPGELIIDWMAYFFLVEWSSDLTNTIPDTVDTTNSTSFTKLSRSPARMELPIYQSVNYAFPPLLNLIEFNSPYLYSSVLIPTAHFNKSLEQITLGNLVSLPSFSSSFLGVFSFLSGGLIQRRFLSMYEIFVAISCRPDTDLITRQQKGYVFWDLWSDLLIGVAEDSNINVSELSNLKEEQNRLLEKLLSSPPTEVNLALSNSIYDISVMSSIYSKKSKKMNKLINSFDLNRITSSPSLIKGLNKSFMGMVNGNHKTNFHQLKVQKINQKSLSKAISWSTSQFLSYQGKDTELFIDLHPPKSFEQLTSIKFSFSLNQPIGLVLCQIYSGLFYKQIAKNLLVVGPPGSEKSMLIQAIAGETELKIITDNAHRYALVFRGVAVGIKLLRDVFEALTLHTPCLFLLEDIHAIGERRPFLISDDENAKGIESSIYQDREEIHEKNQVAYQLTKHIISHYKKPYKGDFSLLIPTNHFCFDLFNSSPQNVQRTRANSLTAGSPLAINTKTNGSEKKTMIDQQQISGSSKKAKPYSSSLHDHSTNLASALQLPKNQLLAPPATSPFSVLVLKEEKKLKPKKIVKEFPWAGLPGEQYANVSKATYSIRVKVALLADMVLSNLSVKLDMITDLLVIIDSVKGNRGFVVFATTHVPYILDPALRRPGRFDETLSLPQIPNLLSRWFISKSNISLWQYKQSSNPKLTISSLNYGEPFSIYPIGVSFSLWETNTSKFLDGAPWGDTVKGHINGSITNSLSSYSQNWHTKYLTKITKFVGLTPRPKGSEGVIIIKDDNLNSVLNTPLLSSSTAKDLNQFKTPKNVNLSKILYLKTGEFKNIEQVNPVLNLTDLNFQTKKLKNLVFLNQTKFHSLKLAQPGFKSAQKLSGSNFTLTSEKSQQSLNSFKKQTILTIKVYNIVSRLLISLQQSTVQLASLQGDKKQVKESSLPDLLTQHKVKNWGDFSFNLRMASMPSNSFLGSCAYQALSKDSLIYTSLYSAPHIFKQHLTVLMAGQMGYTIAKGNLLGLKRNESGKTYSNTDTFLRNMSNLAPQGVINLTTDQTWRTATSLVFSFIQKRWIYQRHLVIPRLLDFGLEGSKPDIPIPPSSNILLPAKRYENYRRTFNYSQLKHKTNNSISEKIQFHQQQRLIKRLYKIPLKEFFRSEILKNHINDTKLAINENKSFSTQNNFNQFTSFSNASIILAPLENYQQKPTSTNWYFRNRLLNRHRTYLSNQWWNGQLREHNPESTFLSDIDWRYTIKSTKEGGIGDLFIDFPDAEQYYNPKNQRWINSSGSWNSWFDFHKSSYDLYSSHYIFECLTNAYKTLDQNRELLDYYVVTLLEKGFCTNNELNEIEILELFQNKF